MKLLNCLTKVFLALLAFVLLSGVSNAAATPIQDAGMSVSGEGATHPWPINPIRFEGTIQGVYLNTTGTVQDIYAQAAKHPMFAAGHDAEEGELAPREKLAPDKILCIPVAGQNWYPPSESNIAAGIRFLRKMKGVCSLAAQNCHRISCSYDSGIYVCNDNAGEVRPMCSTLAVYAQELSKKCLRFGWNQHNWYTGGQAFGNEGFNVIIHTDKC